MSTVFDRHRAGFGDAIWSRFLPLLEDTIIANLPVAGAVTFSAPIAQTGVSAWRAVMSGPAADGSVIYAQPMAGVVVLGISVSAASGNGSPINLVRTGVYTSSSWSWTAGSAIVLGFDGALVQSVPPLATTLQPLGLAISPTRIIVRLDPQTVLG